MTVKISPLFCDAQLDSSGNPASGYKLFTYTAGSSTKQTVYQDSGALSQHTNPILLNSRGEPPAPIWLTSGGAYKFIFTSPTDTDPPASPIRTVDNIAGVNDSTTILDQWVAGPTPTFISTTSFSLVGDQTTAFHVGRRLKTTNSGGTIYSTITVSAFGAVTTVTVVNDSGVLDSGLSAVSYGLLTSTNPSLARLNGALTITGLLTLTGGQISFPATQSASADANTLDDYEEGTWTPTLTFATPGDLNVVYSTRLGTYTKIGRSVMLQAEIITSTFTHTTAVGAVQVTGAPFTSAAGMDYTGTLQWQRITKANYTEMKPQIGGSASIVVVLASGSAQSRDSVVVADMPTAGSVIFIFTLPYHV